MSRSFFASVRLRLFFMTGSFSSVASVPASHKRSLTFVCCLGWWQRIWVSPLCPLHQQPFEILGSSTVLLPITMLIAPSKRPWCGVGKTSLPWSRNFLPLHGRYWGRVQIPREVLGQGSNTTTGAEEG